MFEDPQHPYTQALLESVPDVTKPEKKAKAPTEKAARASESLTPEDEMLFSALRELRLRIARESDVPPFVVFHDIALCEMARLRPTSLAEFGQISGVGKRKLERYGETFVAAIRSLCKES